MSMPIKAIDRLFDRLALTYGAEWTRKWDGVPINDVKTLWAHELAWYASHLQDVAWALENLPERAPNVIEFRDLCRKAPKTELPRLPEPKADPARINAEFAKLRETILAKQPTSYDSKAWAKRIIARHEAGEKITACTLLFAREGLGIKA